MQIFSVWWPKHASWSNRDNLTLCYALFTLNKHHHSWRVRIADTILQCRFFCMHRKATIVICSKAPERFYCPCTWIVKISFQSKKKNYILSNYCKSTHIVEQDHFPVSLYCKSLIRLKLLCCTLEPISCYKEILIYLSTYSVSISGITCVPSWLADDLKVFFVCFLK